MVFTQPPHAIRLFYIIASPAQLWRAGTRAFKFQAGLKEVKALTRGLGRLCGWHRFRALGGQCCVRSAVIWACRKVVRGAIWARRPWTVLCQLLRDRWLECFGGRCFGARIYRCVAQSMVFEPACRSVDFDCPRSWTWSRVRRTGTGRPSTSLVTVQHGTF